MNGGTLTLQADWTAENGIRIRSAQLDRPPVARLFTGMDGDTLLATVPLLYSLCAQAQRAAAAAALAAARGEPLPKVDDHALWRENLHECLWRLCLDWPAALRQTREAQQAARAAFVAWRKKIDAPAAFDKATATAMEFLQQHALRRAAPPSPVRAAMLRAQDTWQALRENRPYPITAQGSNGSGEAEVQTARGLLMHRLELDAAGRIASYQVCAPTDRHFADTAALTARLTTVRPTNFAAARQALECAVLALNPCVPHQILWLQQEN